MHDHQKFTAERGRRAADLRAAAIAALEQQSIAAGMLLDLDSDTVVAAGPKAAILMLLSADNAPAATPGAALPADLQQIKARALAYTGLYNSWCSTYAIADGITDEAAAEFIAAASPPVVLDLIARIERAAAPTDANSQVRYWMDRTHAAEQAFVCAKYDIEKLQRAAASVSGDVPCLRDVWAVANMSRSDLETGVHNLRAAVSASQAAPVSGGEREALQFIHDTFKRDLDAGYRTRDKEFAVAIAAEALAAVSASQAAPIYQVQMPGEAGTSAWRDASQDAYHTFTPEHRRIVFAAPVEQGQGAAQRDVISIAAEIFDFKPHKQTEETKDKYLRFARAVGAGVVPEGWRARLEEMREASYTISQYPETAQVVFDSVIDALDELDAAATAHPVAADDLARDAARYRWIRDPNNYDATWWGNQIDTTAEQLDAIIDAALKSRTTAHGGAQGEQA